MGIDKRNNWIDLVCQGGRGAGGEEREKGAGGGMGRERTSRVSLCFTDEEIPFSLWDNTAHNTNH